MPRNDTLLSRNDAPRRRPRPADSASGRPAATGAPAPGPARASLPPRPRDIGFLLIPGFALIGYACAVEPCRAANVLSGRELYRWRHVSPDGRPVAASNGVTILPDQGIDRPLEVDELYVCAGGNPAMFADAATFAWLRAQALRGVRVGGISGGPYVLARAGLLDGYRFTLHWEHVPALAEEFPRLSPTRSVFEIDRDRATASGGTSALDMMVARIA
ncbi:MAG: AraC family transcriptional regulator, partial [Alphaproteobacteria bacterium]|nr:AraC family transcriptional regulator [Alphaproteobacteria bacterium]